MQLVYAATMIATKAHEGQLRKWSNIPYVSHPLEVGAILLAHGAPEHVIAAGVLHDTLEDTEATVGLLDTLLEDSRVSALVLEVSEVSVWGVGNRAARKALDHDHYAKASDWGKSIKLADTISNLGSAANMPKSFAKTYLREIGDLLPRLRAGDPVLWNKAIVLWSQATLQLIAK